MVAGIWWKAKTSGRNERMRSTVCDVGEMKSLGGGVLSQTVGLLGGEAAKHFFWLSMWYAAVMKSQNNAFKVKTFHNTLKVIN